MNIDYISDCLLNEIITLEDEVNRMLALNHNRETKKVKELRKSIESKKTIMLEVNADYE